MEIPLKKRSIQINKKIYTIYAIRVVGPTSRIFLLHNPQPIKKIVEKGSEAYGRMMVGALSKLNIKKKNGSTSISDKVKHTQQNITAASSKTKNQNMRIPRYGLEKRPGHVMKHRGN